MSASTRPASAVGAAAFRPRRRSATPGWSPPRAASKGRPSAHRRAGAAAAARCTCRRRRVLGSRRAGARRPGRCGSGRTRSSGRNTPRLYRARTASGPARLEADQPAAGGGNPEGAGPSLPCASGTAPAAASAAAPPLDPPAPRSASRGLRVGPCLTDSVEKLITISGTVVSPRVTSPAVRNRAIRSVSRRATALRMLRLPSENGTPAAIGPLSLIRNGTPASGPSAARESAGENSRSARPFTAAFASSTLRQALAVGADVLRVDWPDADYIADLAADEQTPTLALE